ncbi:pantothenate kinase, type III [Aequorivita sublithincola DSM 14238]|uniref:Type III pantothenate kinase n=1 Tax=Aequorivita sublithincola (strain DSM 14238 / LMG 21431 / ACAM 643 / 9-3) TaxID=746697 RepID=I3YT46_AEQSU|nr:type III pantothenate kinase [Aequorivita sublithincola]AFL80164.1 pantothenate kinase, type III [Aequorivita sublithincola DSM 14238]
MNLVIDVGNTLVKLGVFDSGKLELKKTCNKNDFLLTLAEISETFPNITKTIVSSVANLSEEQLSKLNQLFDVFVLNHETKVPFTNKYGTPETLGIDRIALVSAATEHYSNKNVLIIDAGTCVTYDFINEENEYLGGAISPGISLRYKALHTFTEKLPLLETNHPNTYIGNNTNDSIHSGVVNGILFELDGFITEYRKNYNNLTVILTGGDTHFLRDSIKNDIFANSNFLLEGLNHILEYNKL